mmetsp:Transcript_3723/g.10939  ORF Transcript_3723/g.10939 Transcript_3723/m.10939 type:complete len:783 (+) Transcript_3723:54-2402(+)
MRRWRVFCLLVLPARAQLELSGDHASPSVRRWPTDVRCTAADATLEVSLDDTTRRYGLDDAGAVEAIANATWGRAPASYLTRAHAIRVGLAALAETDRLPDLVDAVERGGFLHFFPRPAVGDALLALGAQLCASTEGGVHCDNGIELRKLREAPSQVNLWFAADRSRVSERCADALESLRATCADYAECGRTFAPTRARADAALTAILHGGTDPNGGCWYVVEPNMRLGATGGMRALHLVARQLLDLGRCVRVVTLRDAFADVVAEGSADVARAVNLTAEEFVQWHVPLRPEDTVIVPEVSADFAAGIKYRLIDVRTQVPIPGAAQIVSESADVEETVRDYEARGGIVARYCMAFQPGHGHRPEPSVSVHLGISDWLHRAFSGSGPWAEVSLHPRDLAEAELWRRRPINGRMEKKRQGPPLVVYDDDVHWLDGDEFTEALGRAWVASNRSGSPPVAVMYDGFSGSQRYDLMKNASVYVDLNMPGLEGGISEFLFFDGAPLIPDAFLGTEHDPCIARGPVTDDADVVAGHVMRTLDTLASPEGAKALAVCADRNFAKARAVFGDFSETWRAYELSRRTRFVFFAREFLDWRYAAPFVASAFARHAFSDVVLLTPRELEGRAFQALLGDTMGVAMARLGVRRRVLLADVRNKTGDAVLEHIFPTLSAVREFTVLVVGRATAPTLEALDAAAAGLEPGACAPGDRFVLCRRGPGLDAARVALMLVATLERPAQLDACGDLRRHGLFAQLAAVMYPNALNALDEACGDAIEAGRLHNFGRAFYHAE